jgi:hypothetical protein
MPSLSKDRIIRRAQRIVEAWMARQDIAIVPDRPWSELSHPEKLDLETGQALDIAGKILSDGAQLLERDGLEGTDIKLVTLVKDTALAVIGHQVRIDVARLTAQAMSPAGVTDDQKRKKAREMILEAFRERPPPAGGAVIKHEPSPTEDAGS